MGAAVIGSLSGLDGMGIGACGTDAYARKAC
jgi:hypothetical protein